MAVPKVGALIGAAITAAASVAYNRCRNCKEAKRRNKRGRTKWELCKMQSVRRVQTMTRHDQWGNVNRDTALHGGDKVERWKGGKEGGKLLLSRLIFFPFQKTSAQVSHTNKKAVLRTWLAARERVLIHTPPPTTFQRIDQTRSKNVLYHSGAEVSSVKEFMFYRI